MPSCALRGKYSIAVMVENPSPSADERIEVIDPLVNPEWDRFASSHPFASIFHGTPWCRILVETFGYNPRYLVLKDGGTIRAGLPLMAIKSILTGRRLISLPRTSYCDPLVEEGRDWELLYSAAKDLLRRERFGFLEIKTQLNSSLPGTTGMKCYDHFYNQVLVLGKDLASLWEGFHRTCVRQRIQRAVNDGVRVRTVDDLDGVRDFYRLYMMNARRQLIPPRPFRFFEKIFREFSPNRHVFFLLGEKDGVTGAAGMFFLFNRTMTFEYNAVDYSLGGTRSPNAGRPVKWQGCGRVLTGSM